MRERRLKVKKYLAGIVLVLIVAALMGLLRFGNLDKLKGKIKINDFHLSNINTKLNGSVLDAVGEGPVTSNGFDEVSYELKYRLSNSNQRRDVIIVGTLDSDNGYASFKRLTGNNITSTLSNDNRKIEIVVSDLEPDTEITTIIPLTINGAPDGYRISPSFKIKETTAEDFVNVYTNPIEVSTNNLRGTVTDVDGNTISNIIISVYKNRRLIKETYTNQNGEYIFSDLAADNYTVKINEEIYKDVSEKNIAVSGDTRLDLIAERVYPFTLEVHKYITKVDAINLNTPIIRTYDNASLVAFPVNKLTNFSGKVYYSIVVENTGEKEGIVSVVKDELPSFMSFDEKLNNGFELKDRIIYDRNLEGKVLRPGEKVVDTLVLNIENTNEARTYLNRVNSLGEIYEHVVYILDGNTYKEEDVLEGEKIVKPTDPSDNFSGWYTDSEYTNLYNYNNPVIKDLILYGRTGQKYNVEFYDKNPESGDEELYTSEEVNSGETVDEPNNHPDHTGYNFDYWCTVDFNEYIFSTPVTRDLKLITCYTAKKYDINFYNYSDTVEKNIKVEYKHLIDQNEAPTFDETGYTFICWSDDKTNCYDFTTPVTGNVDLYPIHEILTNAVVFNDENVTTTVDDIPYGNTVNPIDSRGKEGHTFRCWSEDRTNCFDFNTPIIRTTTVYAVYDINQYTVNFVDRDPELLTDTPYGENQTINWGETVTRPENNPTHNGYTFSEWTKTDGTTYNFNAPVTENITLVSKYAINTYPVRFHNDNDVTTVNIKYKHKVTPIDSPTKDHYLFKNWLDENDLVFDFDTLIVEETDLYSSFEEILPPSISHTPTMWTNENVTVTLEKNQNLSDDTGYSYLYKTSETDYATYTDSFTINENTTVIAKGVKQEVDSVVENHQIVNIDKLNPSITLFSKNAVNKNSATLNVNALDNESGVNYYEIYQDNVKVGEKHLECYSETTFDEYETCRSSLPAERVTTYTVTGLSPSTTYTFKVKVYDKAGNSVMSDELEVTTTTPRIVARLIGYNNSLFTDTVDETTGDVTVPKEDKYINFESLAEAFDYEDLYNCKNVQCTIQMVTGTDESVTVLEGQNLTLDLNGQIVSGVNPEYTIKNNGEFTLIESKPETVDSGKIVNNLGVGILNKSNASLTLGEGYSDRQVTGSTVSVTRPYVYGETVGIKNETNGNFTFFDGKIVAPLSQTPGYGAVNGKVTGTEYSYTSISGTDTVDNRDYQVVTLSILVDPEARVNQSVYYSKLSSAMNSVNVGETTFESDNTTKNLMNDLKSTGKYGFIYDENNGTWISSTEGKGTATAYLIIDLTNESNNKALNIDYSVDTDYINMTSFLGGQSYAKITVNEYNGNNSVGDSVPPYQHTETKYGFELEKGKVYIVNISHLGNEQILEMTINDITLSDIETNHTKVSSTDDTYETTYGFYYDERDKKIKSNNQYIPTSSAALGFVEIDLTNKEGQYDVVVDAVMDSYASRLNRNQSIYAEGYIWISEDKSLSSASSFLGFSASKDSQYSVDTFNPIDLENNTYGGYSSYGPVSKSKTISGGKKYYLGFRYIKHIPENDTFPTREEFENANCLDQLIINSIDVIKKSDTSTDIDIFDTTTLDDTLIDQLVENSNGGLILDNGKYRTNNTASNQTMNTSATIDLTNSQSGEMLVVDLTHLPGSNSNYISLSNSSSDTCTNCFTVFQKRMENGEEKKYMVGIGTSLGYNNSNESVSGLRKTRYLLPLTEGYEYEIRFNTVTSSTSLAEYPNIRIDTLETKKLTNFEGNYFNTIYGYGSNINFWFNGEQSNYVFLAGSTFREFEYYKDSFIKIDLSNYEKDQLLSYSLYDDDSYGKPAVYLTDNNRALTKEDLLSNKRNLTIYTANYSETSNKSFILEKGKVYYLHFNSHSDYPESAVSYYSNDYIMGINNLKLTPIDETITAIGNQKVFSGTYNIANQREEKYTHQKRTSDEPTIVGNTIYGFDYNEETGMYDAKNTELGSVAMQTFKIDLSEATEDKLYSIQTNGGGYHSYYTYGDSENLTSIDINNYISKYDDTPPSNYYKLTSDTSLLLEKGKVHYVQVITYKYNESTPQLSLKITEVNTSNSTENYNSIKEIREFNSKVDTVQLLKDVVVDAPINVDYSEEVVLDVNGYSLSASNSAYIINNSGDLTLSDSKYTQAVSTYENELAEYQEYAGLCDGCEPSAEYVLDHSLSTNFDYTGDVQEFIAPESGEYVIEAWGAQGGSNPMNSNVKGGYGAYSKGVISLQEGDKIYIYVGGAGKDGNNGRGGAGGYNGGGSGGNGVTTGSAFPGAGGGGGATHVSKVSGTLSTLESYKGTLSADESYYISNDIIIVAGGGGGAGPNYTGANDSKPGGSGGGSKGSDGETWGATLQAFGATQTSGNSFGQGANGRKGTWSNGAGNEGTGGGGGGFYGGKAQTSTGNLTDSSGGGGSGYIANPELTSKKMVMYSENSTYESTNENTKTEITTNHSVNPIPDYAKEGNGYVKISKNLSQEQIDELYNNLPKRYNVKNEPTFSGTKSWISNNGGTGIIKNNENATLSLDYVNLSVSSTQGIMNEGTLKITGETNINVTNEKSTGILNYVNGDIINNGKLTISVEPGCGHASNYSYAFGATGINFTGGTHNLSNVTITGTNGTGIIVDTSANVNLHSSNINMNTDYCYSTRFYNSYDNYTKTDSSNSSLYDKTYSYRLSGYKYTGNYYYERLNASIANLGNTSIDSGSNLVGRIETFGKLNITDGSNFNNIYQADKYRFRTTTVKPNQEFDNPTTNISNIVTNVDQIVNRAGTVNITEDTGETSAIASSGNYAILNFDRVNTSGGVINRIFNIGLLNSNNTNYDKVYNLHTYFYNHDKNFRSASNTNDVQDYRGTANINGGTISTDTVVNEYKMTLNNVTVPTGIINRGDLTVKGNSIVTGNNKSAILNYPFKLNINNESTYRFSRTSLTLGDENEEATGGPTISTTNGSYAITGDCNSKGTTPLNGFTLSYYYFSVYNDVTQYLKYTADNETSTNITYINSSGLLTNSSNRSKDKIIYPENADNLCGIKYYDGKIQNTTTTDITDVVDIPINDVRSGYDILYDNSDSTGKVTMVPIDSESRNNVIDVNGTPYKSLETAINNAPNNSVINISGNYDSANKVIIPSDKTLTINYLNGAKVNSYRRDGLITNNGALTLTGNGTNNIIGVTGFENNNNMTFNGVNNTDHSGNYDAQSNLINNNKNLTINNVTSNGLDIVTNGEESTLTINDGTFNSNTIFGNNSNITLTGGYFETGTNSNYYETTIDKQMQQSISHYKPLFNVNSSIVSINNFDVDNDSRYNSITREQNLGIFDTNSTLNLNNSKFGGKSSKGDIYTAITGGSTININGGEYNKLFVNLRDNDNIYNQSSGTLNGILFVSGHNDPGYTNPVIQGNRNKVNITGGKINSTYDTGILLMNVSDTIVTIGTKGDYVSGTETLNVSKTNPEIKGSDYGIAQRGSYTTPSKLYFYDGIFKGSGNPIDFRLEEVEEGYDVVFNRSANPMEKYLDILPVIYNQTTDTHYYDVQQAFDEANTDDVLVWIKDYTNFSYSPSFTVAANKKFTLYLSYLKAVHTGSGNYLDDYRAYDETVTPSADENIGASYITINNEKQINPDTGEEEEVPFIINNGNLTIVAAAASNSGNGGEIDVDSNFESVSGATIVKNNGTLNLNGVTSINIKALGTMYENNGTMNIKKSRFETLQSNILTNNGTLNITGADGSTSDCYNPTYMKVHVTDSLYNNIDLYIYQNRMDLVHKALEKSIINNANATMNIEYLSYDSDYSYTAILNDGTLDISHSSIEQYRNDNVTNTLPVDKSIINNGTMTATDLTTLSTKGILNTNNLTYDGNTNTINAGFDTGITNSGTLTFAGSISGAGRGIYDTGNTNINGAGITTYREIYYGVGPGTVSMNGSFSTYGSYTRTFSAPFSVIDSCTNGTVSKRSVGGTLNNPLLDRDCPGCVGSGKDYPLSTGGVYVDGGRTLTVVSAGIGFNGLSSLAKTNGSCYKDGIKYDVCPAPYEHENRNGPGNETKDNYSVGAIEAHNANVIFQNGSISGASGNSNTYGIHSTYSNIQQNGGMIGSMYVANSVQDVTIGTKDGNKNETNSYLGKTSCSTNFKGINFYSGVLALDSDKLCHFADKEDNYNIIDSGMYSLDNSYVILNVDTNTPYESIQTAINDASSGDTLQFQNSTSLILSNYDITVNKDLIIDTNGKLIDANFNIISGTTTVKDSTNINGNGKIAKITNTSGTLDFINGNLDVIDNKSTAYIEAGNIKKIDNSGTLNITNNVCNIDEITNSGTLNVYKSESGSKYKYIKKISTTGAVTITNTALSSSTNIIVTESGSLSLVGTTVNRVETYNGSTLSIDSESVIKNLHNENVEATPLTITGGTVNELENIGHLVINGTNITGTLNNKSSNSVSVAVTINSGTINILENHERYTLNNGTITRINDSSWDTSYIYNGYVRALYITYQGGVNIEGGELGYINNTNGGITIGKKDGVVNTNSPIIRNLTANSYAIASPSNRGIYFYDGTITSTKPIVIDATISRVEEGHEIYTAPDYDELGNLTGTYSMTLKEISASGESKVACVEGICYSSLQEAIDASVRNYNEIDGCPEVRIGDEFYFSVELDEDLVLDPQYSLTINLNSHNINDNGFNIPENITLTNGSRNGTNLESSLARFLANVFGTNLDSKDIIITKMSDGNALDSAKTYKLYNYNNGEYIPMKVVSDGAGKYKPGNETLELKAIKGRIYINDLNVGEYMLKDNLDNELEFTIYDNGTISPNITENITSNYGRVSASAVATLIVTIQTGIFRNGYILIGIMIIVLGIIGLLLYRKNKSIKETI